MTVESDRLITLGAQTWHTGRCERGVTWGYGLPYCDRRARWEWHGNLYCATCARAHAGYLPAALGKAVT